MAVLSRGDLGGVVGSCGERPTLIVVTDVAPAPIHDGATARTQALFKVLVTRYRLICVLMGDEEDCRLAARAFPGVEWIAVPKPSPLGAKIFSKFGAFGSRASFFLDHYLLGAWTRTTCYYHLNRTINAIERERPIHGIFVRFIFPALMMGPVLRPVVVDVDDDLTEFLCREMKDSRIFRAIIIRWRNWLMIRRYKNKLRELDGAIFSRCDDVDRNYLFTKTFYVSNHFSQNLITSRKIKRLSAFGLRVGFIGNDTPANREAVEWLLRNIVVPIKEKNTNVAYIEFVLAGKICEWFKRAFHDKISLILILGVVDNPVEFYSHIDVATCPVHLGAGASVKFFESIGHGVPIMATSFGARGFAENGSNGVMISDDPLSWRRHIDWLATQPSAYEMALEDIAVTQQKLSDTHRQFSSNVLSACAIYDTSSMH